MWVPLCWGSVVLGSLYWANLGGQTGTFWSGGRVEKPRLNQRLTSFFCWAEHTKAQCPNNRTQRQQMAAFQPALTTRESLLSFWLSKVDIRWQLPLLLLPSRLMCSAILYGFWESNVGGARPDFSIQRNTLVLVYYYLREVMASLLQHGNCCWFLHSSWVLYMVLLEHICLLYQA